MIPQDSIITPSDSVAQQDTCYVCPLATDTAEAEHGVSLLERLHHTFFTDRDTLGIYDKPLHSFGTEGTPVPYAIRGDNMITTLLIVCFVIFVASFSHAQHFFSRQLKSFFFTPYSDNNSSETRGELHFLIFLLLVDCLLLAIEVYLFATDIGKATFAIDSDLLVMALLFAAFAAYFIIKAILYSFVNLVFFDGKRNLQLQQTLLFLTAIEGIALFPMVMLQIYFDLSVEKATYYFITVLFLNKILTFYKVWIIFFRQNGLFLQFFLYLCALEIAPLLALAGIGTMAIDLLKVNY